SGHYHRIPLLYAQSTDDLTLYQKMREQRIPRPRRGRGIGVSRESIRPGRLLPKQLPTGDLTFSQIYKICEKVRLKIQLILAIPIFYSERHYFLGRSIPGSAWRAT